MLFAIFCTDKEDHLDVRLDNRSGHLAHLKSIGDKLMFAGPTLGDDGETMNGSLIVVDMNNRADVEAFAAEDPYKQHGLFENVVIRPWNKVLG